MKKNYSTKEQGFVLRHYQEGAFNPDEALKRVAQPTRQKPLRRWVAAAASLLCLVAIAGVMTWRLSRDAAPESPLQTKDVPAQQSPAPQTAKSSFHFDDTPLPQVLEALESYYSVHLSASDTTKHLTGDFGAGNLDETLSTIEEVLDVRILPF